eukprot:403364213
MKGYHQCESKLYSFIFFTFFLYFIQGLEFQFQTGSILYPTLVNTETLQRNQFGVYMHNDAIEFVATAANKFDMTNNMPFKMELYYYTCKNSSYYVFSTTDYTIQQEEYFSIYVDQNGFFSVSILLGADTKPKIRNTGIKAYPGFTYVVFMIEKYGIGSTPRTKIQLYVRNNNIMSYQQSAPTSYSESDLIGLPQAAAIGTTRYLFGHKGQSDKVKTSMHMNGIFRLFKTYENVAAPTTDMIETWVNTQWSSIYTSTNPTTQMNYLANDLSYIAKLDFDNIQSDQIIPDNKDATFSATAPQYGTNQLLFGDTDMIDSTDPLYVPDQGTLFGSGKYAYGKDSLALTAAQSVDFTIEIWYRLNTFVTLTKGTVQTLIIKSSSLANVNSYNSGGDFGVQFTDKFARIHFMGSSQDIPIPLGLFDLLTKTFPRSWISQNNNTITEMVNQEWRMLAVNYRRSQQYLGTHAYVYFDLETPIELFFTGKIYSTITTATDDVWVGKDFEGLIRSIFVYSHFPSCTYFAQNSKDSYKYYEYNRYQYEFLMINNLDYNNATCKKRTLSQAKCNFCTLHQTSSDYPANQCYSTCPLNSYSSSCRECDSRCQFCTNYLPDSCLQCKSDSATQPVYTNSQGWCTRDIGYYRNNSMPRGTYEKCDSRCLVCTDSTNYCDRCVEGAYKVDGSYCVWQCPPGYKKGNSVVGDMASLLDGSGTGSASGICEVDRQSVVYKARDEYGVGVSLDKRSNAIVQKCAGYQYYDSKTLSCKECDESCLTCSAGGDNFCTTCPIGSFLQPPRPQGKCLMCNTTDLIPPSKSAVIGLVSYFSIGPLSQCIEVCGKGRNYGLLQCDDGNTLNGDGCSSTCSIESGWTCSGGNSTTKDTCKYQKTKLNGIEVTENNQFIVQFTRPVIFRAVYNLSISNSGRLLQNSSVINSTNGTNSSNSTNNSITYQSISKNVSISKEMFKLWLQDIRDPYSEWFEYSGDWGIPQSFLQNQSFPALYLPFYTDMNQTGLDYSIYRIKLGFAQTSTIQNQILDQIFDANQQPIDMNFTTAFVQGTLNKIDMNLINTGSLTNSDKFDKTNQISTVVVFLLVSAATLNLMNSIIMFKPMSLSIILVLAAQQIYLTSLINKPNGEYLQDFMNVYFQSFKFSMFQWDFGGNQVIIDALINDFTLRNVYGLRFTEAGYFYNCSIANLAIFIWFWMLYFILFVPFSMAVGYILKISCGHSHQMKKYAQALMSKPMFSGSSLFFIIMALPMILPTILELNFYKNNKEQLDNSQDFTNQGENSQQGPVYALILMLIGFIQLLVTILINKNHILSQEYSLYNEKVKQIFGSLFSPFKPDTKAIALLLTFLSLTMALYVTFMRPFKLMSLNFSVSSLEFILSGHFLIFYFTQLTADEKANTLNQQNTYYDALESLMYYDLIAFILLFVGVLYDTSISLYKYHYWVNTGTLPKRFGRWFERSEQLKQMNKSLKQKQFIETSNIGLMEGQPLDGTQPFQSSMIKPANIHVKNNTFMDALEQEDKLQSNDQIRKNLTKSKKTVVSRKKPKKDANKKDQEVSQIQQYVDNSGDPQDKVSSVYDQYMNDKKQQKANSDIQVQEQKQKKKVISKRQRNGKSKPSHNTTNIFAADSSSDENYYEEDDKQGLTHRQQATGPGKKIKPTAIIARRTK